MKKQTRKKRRSIDKLCKYSKKNMYALGLALTLSLSATTYSYAADPTYSNVLPELSNITGGNVNYNGVCSAGDTNLNQATANSYANSSTRLDINITSKVSDGTYYSYNIGKGKTVNYNFT